MNIYFTIFECLVLILFLACMLHAVRTGLRAVLRLLAGAVFGVALEWATIVQLNAYAYGTFNIMVDTVPIIIGIAWGVILYSAMLFSNATALRWYQKPVLDALLALNIDIGMDAIAIRIGMWDWGRGLDFEYFGVPYANFWAWFWVIFSFSFFFRAANQFDVNAKIWIAPLLALMLGVAGVLATNLIIAQLVPYGYTLQAALFVILTALIYLYIVLSKTEAPLPMHPITHWVPIAFHIYFLTVGFITGVIFDSVYLVLMGLVMFVLSIYINRRQLTDWSALDPRTLAVAPMKGDRLN